MLNRSLKPVILLVLLFVSVSQAKAQFTYTTNGGTIIISGYTGSGGAVVIPSSVEGMQVVGIAASVFYNKTTITSVTIPSSVTSIGNSAFQNCSGLTSLTISSGVTNFGTSAFAGCDGLTSITIPSSVTSMGGYVFGHCTGLTNVTISSGATSIGESEFQSCTRLTSLIIPSSVTSISSYAFSWCSGLTNIFFQGNVPSPSDDTTVFSGTPATVYYFSGTIGWGAVFDGIPTVAVYMPPPLGMSTYGPSNFPVVFFPTATGTNFALQTTTNLTSGPWVNVTNGIPISGFIITNVQPAAFFRLQ